jgi:replicative DNA helicase
MCSFCVHRVFDAVLVVVTSAEQQNTGDDLSFHTSSSTELVTIIQSDSSSSSDNVNLVAGTNISTHSDRRRIRSLRRALLVLLGMMLPQILQMLRSAAKSSYKNNGSTDQFTFSGTSIDKGKKDTCTGGAGQSSDTSEASRSSRIISLSLASLLEVLMVLIYLLSAQSYVSNH